MKGNTVKKPEQTTKSNDDIILELEAEAARLETEISAGIEEGDDVIESINRIESIRRELVYRRDLATKIRKAAARREKTEALKARIAALEEGSRSSDATMQALQNYVKEMTGLLEQALTLQRAATGKLKGLGIEYSPGTWTEHLSNNIANFARAYLYYQKQPKEFLEKVDSLINQIGERIPAALEQAKRELADFLEKKPE